jgi:hypothetical protein
MRRLGATIAVLLLATPAIAGGILPFKGAFGNADGCHLYATGQFLSDDVFLLTPDTFASYGTGCDFEALVSAANSVFTVQATCSAEGEVGLTDDLVRIIDHGTEGYGIQFESLEEWGPYTACPPIPGNDSGTVQL